MALRIPPRKEVGQRVRWLRKQADLTGRALAQLIEASDNGLFTKIEKHGESFDYERLMAIANACEGRGQLIADAELLYLFLLGVKEQGDVLRPRFRVVEGGLSDSSVRTESEEVDRQVWLDGGQDTTLAA